MVVTVAQVEGVARGNGRLGVLIEISHFEVGSLGASERAGYSKRWLAPALATRPTLRDRLPWRCVAGCGVDIHATRNCTVVDRHLNLIETRMIR